MMTPESTIVAKEFSSEIFSPEREVRFAVMMYGGVSLAIFINGVAQELLNLVRATAPHSADPDETKPLLTDEQLTGAGKVYRKLGRYLYGDRSKLQNAELGETAPLKK